MDSFQFLLTGEGRQGMGNRAHGGEKERGYLWPGPCGEDMGKGGFPFLGGLCHTLLAGREFMLRDKNARPPEGGWEKEGGQRVTGQVGR